MKRIIVVAFAIVLSICSISAYCQPQSSIIKAQALEMTRALQARNFPSFLKFMHPKIVEMAGGSDKMIQQMDTVNAMAKKFGAEIKKITIGNPGKIISYKKELQAILPQTTEMTSAFGDLALESTLVAISADGGKTWKFIDTSVTSVKQLKQAMPELSPELQIPAPKPPKFTPREE